MLQKYPELGLALKELGAAEVPALGPSQMFGDSRVGAGRGLHRLANPILVGARAAVDALCIMRLRFTGPNAQREALAALLTEPNDGAAAPGAVAFAAAPGNALRLLTRHELFALLVMDAEPDGGPLRVAGLRAALEERAKMHPRLGVAAFTKKGVQRISTHLAGASNLEMVLDLFKFIKGSVPVARDVLALATSPPRFAGAVVGEADAALALCDAFVFARIGSYNMLAVALLNADAEAARLRVRALAAVAAHERWTCAVLQEMPGYGAGVTRFRDLLRLEPFFNRWAVLPGPGFPGFQGLESAYFIYDRRFWSAVSTVASLIISPGPLGEPAAPGVAAAFMRPPGLLFLRAAAWPNRVLGLISVHARPDKNAARAAARLLGRHAARWVRSCAEHLQIAEGTYVTVIAGDHNIAAMQGGRPDPADAWAALTGPDGAFDAVPFPEGVPRFTNAHDLLMNPLLRFEFDHAFIGRAACAAWPLRASARVCDVAAPLFSWLATEYLAARNAVTLLRANTLDLLVLAALDDLEERVRQLRLDARAKCLASFGDHKPITITLLEQPAAARAAAAQIDLVHAPAAAAATASLLARIAELEAHLLLARAPLPLVPAALAAAPVDARTALQRFLNLYEKPHEPLAVFGLPNLGETCFLAAPVQLLAAVPAVRELAVGILAQQPPHAANLLGWLVSCGILAVNQRKLDTREAAVVCLQAAHALLNPVQEHGRQGDAAYYFGACLAAIGLPQPHLALNIRCTMCPQHPRTIDGRIANGLLHTSIRSITFTNGGPLNLGQALVQPYEQHQRCECCECVLDPDGPVHILRLALPGSDLFAVVINRLFFDGFGALQLHNERVVWPQVLPQDATAAPPQVGIVRHFVGSVSFKGDGRACHYIATARRQRAVRRPIAADNGAALVDVPEGQLLRFDDGAAPEPVGWQRLNNDEIQPGREWPVTILLYMNMAAPFAPPRTLALCFLVSGTDLDLPDVWAEWLAARAEVAAGTGAAAEAARRLVRIFVHGSNQGVPPPAQPEPMLLADAERVPWVRTGWGTFGTVRAQVQLFNAALADDDVACCVLLSGDSVPLVPFDEAYDALMEHAGAPGRADGGRSLLAARFADDAGVVLNTTHQRREAGALELRREAIQHADSDAWAWHLGVASQWCALARRHVELLAAHWHVLESTFDGSSVPDEHVYAVFFRDALGDAAFAAEFERRSPMHTAWKGSIVCRSGPNHADADTSPTSYHLAEISPMLVANARAAGFLFMRKVCLAQVPATPSAQLEVSRRTWQLRVAALERSVALCRIARTSLGADLLAACSEAANPSASGAFSAQHATDAQLILNHVGVDLDRADALGRTALQFACLRAELDGVAERLVVAGADLDAVDNNNGASALIKACAKKRGATALLLVQADASLDAFDADYNMSALDYAVESNLAEVVAAIHAWRLHLCRPRRRDAHGCPREQRCRACHALRRAWRARFNERLDSNHRGPRASSLRRERADLLGR